MTSERSPRTDHHFANLTDPRRAQVTYPLIDVVTIASYATIAGADDFVAMADWARQHKEWLGKFLERSASRISVSPRPGTPAILMNCRSDEP